MTYPTAYRKGAGRHAPGPASPGFQRPTPGNDNRRGPIPNALPRGVPKSAPIGDIMRRIPLSPGAIRAPLPFNPLPWLPRILPFVPGGLAGGIVAYEIWQHYKGRRWIVPDFQGYRRYSGPFSYGDTYSGQPQWIDPQAIFWTYLTGQYISHAHGLTIPIVGDDWPNFFGLWISSSREGSPFHAHHSSYERVITETPPIEIPPASLVAPNLQTGGLPGGDPGAFPLNPFPVQPPYWAIPYMPHQPGYPNGEPERGQPSHDPAPAPVGDPFIGVTVTPSTVGPGTATTVSSGEAPRSNPNKGRDRDPVKEKKVIANMNNRTLLGRFIGAVTEGLDFMNAAWEAIPPEKRPGMKFIPTRRSVTGQLWKSLRADGTIKTTKKGNVLFNGQEGRWVQKWSPNPSLKLKHMYDHYDDIELDEFVKNIFKNQIEDAAIGKASRFQTKQAQGAYKLLKRPVGWTTGPAL